MKPLDFFKVWKQFKFSKNTGQTKRKLSWGQVQSLAPEPARSLSGLTPGSLLLQCQHLTTRWSSRDAQTNFPLHSAILFAPRCAQTHTLGSFLKPVLPSLYSPSHLQAQAPSPRIYNAPVLRPRPPFWNHCQAPSPACQLPPTPSSGPHTTGCANAERASQAGPESGGITLILPKCEYNFPGSLSWVERNSHGDGGRLEPQSDSGLLRTLWQRRSWHLRWPSVSTFSASLFQWFSILASY